MFEDSFRGLCDLVLPGTSYLERDGTTVNLEGRLQRQRRAVIAPCPDELAWIAKLAERFGVELSPHASLVFDEVSAICYGGIALRRGRRAGAAARRAPSAAQPAERRPAKHSRRRARACGSLTYRPLFSGPAVERTPELDFQRRERRGRARPRRRARARRSPPATRSRSARTARRVALRARIARDLAAGTVRIAARRRRRPPRARRGDEVSHPTEPWWISLIEVAHRSINLVMVAFAYTTWLERKVLGRMQLRYGPNRAGPFGLLQPIADLIKLVRKEAFYPGLGARAARTSSRPVALVRHRAARVRGDPVRAAAGRSTATTSHGAIANVPISLILIFALGSIGIYGFIVGGWASDSKYSMLGSMRTCAQLVSYEVSLALTVLGVVMMGRSLNLVDIVDRQQATLWFFIPQFVGLVHLPARRDRRDLAAAVRPPRGRHRARRRVPHRVLRHALGPLPDGRVHQHDRALGALRDALLRRLAVPVGPLARPLRADLVPAQARRSSSRLHLAARLAAAPPLRPADALRLEGPAAGRDRQRPRHRPPRGVGRMSALVPNTFKGFGVTLKQVFRKPITQQYPEYKRPGLPALPRPPPALHLHENGLEKCVGCSLCAAACPADCIRVVAAENTAENRVSAGERYARIYEINMSRCIFCGYCELACPFDAITLGNDFEISEYNRDDLIYTKDMLLAEPIKQVPVADRDLYDTPIPYYKIELVAMANFLVWCVWVVAAFACVASALGVVTLPQPVLLGARADREPRLARGALPAARRRVRRGGAGARLRRRGDGHVPVRDRLPRRPDRRGAVGRRPVVAGRRRPCSPRGAILVEVIVAIGALDRRLALALGRRSRARSARRRRSGGSS